MGTPADGNLFPGGDGHRCGKEEGRVAESGGEYRGEMVQGVDIKGESWVVEEDHSRRGVGEIFYREQGVKSRGPMASANRFPGRSEGGVGYPEYCGGICVPGGLGMPYPVGRKWECDGGGGRGVGKGSEKASGGNAERKERE